MSLAVFILLTNAAAFGAGYYLARIRGGEPE